jgi:hypothetical protein
VVQKAVLQDFLDHLEEELLITAPQIQLLLLILQVLLKLQHSFRQLHKHQQQLQQKTQVPQLKKIFSKSF